MRKQWLVSLSLLLLGVLLWVGTRVGDKSSETAPTGSSTHSLSPTSSLSSGAKVSEIPGSGDIPEPGQSFPCVEGWPLAEEFVFGPAEQRQILDRVRAQLEVGAITEDEVEETILAERQDRIELINDYNSGPADRTSTAGTSGESL